MAKTNKSILNDHRWQALAIKYRNDRVRFCVEVMGHTPSKQQREVLRAMDRKGARVSVASGHGTGKSYIAGDLVMHQMLCFVKPEIILTANNIEQVRGVVFKYVSEGWSQVCKRFPWLRKYFELTNEVFYCKLYKKSWYALAKTVPPEKPEGIAGRHNKNLLYIVDEASGIDDRIFSVIKGALSEEHNKLLMFSQPTRNSGEFYDSHHSKAKSNPDDPDEPGYIPITLNSEESPFVNLQALREYIKTYAGVDTPEYQIKVRGEFSDQLEGYLITRRACDRAQALTTIDHAEQWGYVIVADVGGGVERDSSVVGVFKISGYDMERKVEPVAVTEMPKTMDAVELAAHIWQMKQDYPTASVAVDANGIGSITANELDKKNVDVQRITWGLPCHAEAHKKRFHNQRAYCNVALRDGINSGRVRLDSSKTVIEQISKLPHRLNEQGRYVMMSKDDMRQQGIKSPDWADVYAMAMMADVIPHYDYENTDSEEDDYLQKMVEAALA
ncbi:MAG: hypothetical protein OIF57_17475 [Marinobacterium sp.]|nr:hypothetical protein [Marinobacterium sp.]